MAQPIWRRCSPTARCEVTANMDCRPHSSQTSSHTRNRLARVERVCGRTTLHDTNPKRESPEIVAPAHNGVDGQLGSADDPRFRHATASTERCTVLAGWNLGLLAGLGLPGGLRWIGGRHHAVSVEPRPGTAGASRARRAHGGARAEPATDSTRRLGCLCWSLRGGGIRSSVWVVKCPHHRLAPGRRGCSARLSDHLLRFSGEHLHRRHDRSGCRSGGYLYWPLRRRATPDVRGRAADAPCDTNRPRLVVGTPDVHATVR